MIWYPLPDIFLRLSLAVAAGFIVTGIAYGYETGAVAGMFKEFFRELAAANPELPEPGTEELERTARLYAAMIPLIVPAMWLMVHVLVFYLSALIARQSGRLARQGWDIPAEASLPVAAIGLPLAGIVGMVAAPSPVYEVAAVMAGVGVAAFGLIGFAEIHHNSRNKPGRGLILFASWMLFFMFSVPILIFAVFGAMRAWRRGAGGGPPAIPPSPPPSSGRGPDPE